MGPRRITAFASVVGLIVAGGFLPWAPPLDAKPVRKAKAACQRAKAFYSTVEHFPISVIAFCDTIASADSPKGFYVLALHSHCRRSICGSTNMGWFAVEKRTGRVFEWDVAEDKLGKLIKAHR